MSNEQTGKEYIGLTLEQFKAIFSGDYRIKKVDGEHQRLEADFNLDRINLTLENGVIVSIDWF